MQTDDVIPAKPAATVMVVRDADPGVEVFMLRRTLGAAFAAGMFVFPGGRVDLADGGPAIEPFVDGIDDDEASRELGVDRGGLAFWVAAIRECFEESGLLLARSRSGGALGYDPSLRSPAKRAGADRAAVHRGDLSMIDLCRRHGLVLDAGALRYVAHWVTPIGETPRRFDTRFFLAVAPPGQDGVHDEAETVDSRWVRPADALRDAKRGALTMMPPTVVNLDFLAGCADAGDAIRKADAAGPPKRIQPKIRRDPAGKFTGFSMPGDPDYDDWI